MDELSDVGRPSASGKNHRIGKDDELIVGGDKAKIKANLAAIKLLKKLEKENRDATPEEKQILAKYVGWGGLKNVFDETTNQYVPELKDLLTPEEYRSARASVLNAHYTERAVIEKMWELAEKLGFRGGQVGEFGAGIGHFLGLVPDNLVNKTKFRAVELDSITGRLLKKLYPEANVTVDGLQNTKIPSNSLSMVIGNVPFAETVIRDSRYKKGFTLHNYFIARAIDAVRPGGLVITITSHGTMDSLGTDARKYFESKADFIGAVRLPGNAFQKNAGTSVVTDILVFRKKTDAPSQGEAFVNTEEFKYGDSTVPLNEYFVAKPDMMLGKPSIGGGMYNSNSFLLTSKSKDLAGDIDGAMQKIVDAHPAAQVDSTINEPLPTNTDKSNLKDSELYIENGKLKEWHTDRDGADKSVEVPAKSPAINKKNIQRVEAFQKLKNAHNSLINGMKRNCSDEELKSLQDALKKEYDKFVKEFGNIADRRKQRLLKEDPTYLRASGLETIDTKTVDGKEVNTYTPSDIFTKRTITIQQEPTSAATAKEAAYISMKYRGRMDPAYMEQLTGRSYDDLKDELTSEGSYFDDPESGMLVERSEYLSGNIREKLDAAEERANDDESFKKNVDALKAAMPAPKTIEGFTFRLGARWIPPRLIDRWVKDDLNGNVTVKYNKALDQYQVDGWVNNPMFSAYGIDTKKLLQSALNLKSNTVYDYVEDMNGRKRPVVNHERTQAVEDLKSRMIERFHDWVKKTPEATKAIENAFNEKVNVYVSREMSGQKATEPYPGASAEVNGKPFLLRSYQRNAVERTMRGNTLLAHCVGAGKTATMVTSAMELVRTGMAKKPLIVVQNVTLEQFGTFASSLYPTARILSIDSESFSKENRQRTISKIMNNEWDLVIMPQSQFNLLDINPDTKEAYYQRLIDEMRDALEETRRNGDRFSVRDIEARIKSFEEKIRRLDEKRGNKDQSFFFDDLGVDALYIDEAHAYKKPFFVTSLKRIKGLNTQTSERALDLTIKIEDIMQRTGGKNVFFATGTPVTNTLAEAWHMVRYLTPKGKMPYGCETFDQFVTQFCEVESTVEPNAAGNYTSVKRLSKFVNLDELSTFFRSVGDVVLPENLKGKVKRPPLKNGKPTEIIIEKSPYLDKFMNYLADMYRWYNSLSGREKIEEGPIPLIINGLAVKATVDMRLVNPGIPADTESKISRCAQEVKARYDQLSKEKAAQAIFFDNFRFTDKNTKKVTFNAYDEMKQQLVALGIPEDEIACIDKVKDKAREQLFADLNSGRVRVVIGGTETLGTGANFQERLAAIHNLDATYMPSGMEQRRGRIDRSGNTMKEIEIVNYAIKGTLDEVKYQLLARKQKFINSVMRGDAVGEFVDEDSDSIDYETFAARVSGNPDALRFVETKAKLNKLNGQYQLYLTQQNQAKEELNTLEHSEFTSIPAAEKLIARREREKTKFEKVDPEKVRITQTDGKSSTLTKDQFRELLDRYIEKEKPVELKMNVNGFDMTFVVNKEILGKNGKELVNSYQIMNEDGVQIYSSEFKSGAGFLQSYSNYVKKADERIEEAKNVLKQRTERAEELKKSIGAPFEQQQELDDTQAEFDRLQKTLVREEAKWEGGRPGLSSYLEGVAAEAVEDFSDMISQIRVEDEEGGESRSFKLKEPVDSVTENDSPETISAEANTRHYKLVTDKKLIKELDSEPYITTYRAAQLVEGKLYPPMAAKIDGEWVPEIQLGKWEQSDENPEKIVMKNGKAYFPLNKGNGKTIMARYNPYLHSSLTPLNDQFSSASERPGLVTLEIHVPKSELTSGYHADKAKDSVGMLEWKAGPVQSKLSGTRKVMLSRYDKPVRIVPDSEVAKIIKGMVRGKVDSLPANVLTPSLRSELEKIGVPISDNRKYKLARPIQVNPLREEGPAKYTYQEKLDNSLYEVLTKRKLNDKAARLLAGYGSMPNLIKSILNGDFKPNSPEAQRALTTVLNSEDYKNLSPEEKEKIADVYIKSGTSIGQALNARRLGALDLTDIQSIQAHVNALIAKMGKEKARTLRDEIIDEFGVDIDKMPEDIVDDPHKLDEMLRKIISQRATLGDKLYEYWINAILSSPTTHAANAIGNTANAAYELGLKRLAEAVVNVFMRKKDAATFGEFKEMANAVNWRDAFRRAKFVYDVETLTGDSKLDRANAAIGGQAGRIIRIPGRLLRAADEFAKAIVQPMEAAAYAYRDAKAHGMSDEAARAYILNELKNADSDANVYGRKRALDLTFQEKPYTAIRQLISWRESGGVMGTMLKFFLPFIKTPSNILKQGVRKSPLGAANLAYQTVQGLRGKREFDNEYISLVAEQVLAWGLVAMLASGDDDDDKPLITGSSPRYGSAEQKFKANKVPPYSIRIGKNYYSYQRIEPLSTGLAFIADGIEAMKAAKRGEDGTRIVKRLMGKMTRLVAEKSFLDSLGQIQKLVEDPETSVPKWASSFAASWMPNAVRTTVNVFDDTVHDKKNRERGAKWFEEQFYLTMDAAGIPKASPKRDYFGRIIKKDSLADSGPLWQMMRLVPIKSVSPDDNMNRAEKLMWKYNMSNPDKEYYLDVPAYYFTRDGQKLYMTGKYYDEFVEKSGKLALKQINNAFKHGLLNDRKPTEKDIDLIKKIFTRARKEVRDEMYEKKHYTK